MVITPFYGEILILCILAICCLRTYFITNTRLDALAIFAPFGLILSILQIINWGFNICEILVLLVSLLVFFTNYRSFIRFCNHLYVDCYRTPFIVSSSIALVLIIILAIVVHINAPKLLSPEKNFVKVESFYYGKNSQNKFVVAENPLDKKDFKVTIYSPVDEEKIKSKNSVVLFVPDKRAGTLAYEPYLVLLAKKGYKIYCGEFGFSTVEGISKIHFNQWHRFKLIRKTRKEKNDNTYFSKNEKFLNAYTKEFEILNIIANQNEPIEKKFVAVGDGPSGNCFDKIKNPARKISSSFNINQVPDYKTSGLGFIEYSDPLYAKLFYGIKPNKVFFVPSYVVTKTKNAIEAAQ